MKLDKTKPIRRIAIYFFYDKDGIVDDYIPYLLRDLVKNVEKLQELYHMLDLHELEYEDHEGTKIDLESIMYNNDKAVVNFIKVEGHSDNVGNNRADELAVKAKAMA